MSDFISFDSALRCSLRAASIRVLLNTMSESKDPAFSSIILNSETSDAMGYWDFEHLSAAALGALRDLVETLARDSVKRTSHWDPEWRPTFREDIERLRNAINQRITKLAQPG